MNDHQVINSSDPSISSVNQPSSLTSVAASPYLTVPSLASSRSSRSSRSGSFPKISVLQADDTSDQSSSSRPVAPVWQESGSNSASSPASAASLPAGQLSPKFTFPPLRGFISPTFAVDPGSKMVSQNEKDRLIQCLQTHRIKTLTELRRIERLFASIGTPDVTGPMTSAWTYYVNSHNLLTELRSLTKHYPFSSECLEDAKQRVIMDPASNRSWNLCWLILSKIQQDRLVYAHAYAQASRPEMWGNRAITADGINQLSQAFVSEWTRAVEQLLKNWEQPPCR